MRKREFYFLQKFSLPIKKFENLICANALSQKLSDALETFESSAIISLISLGSIKSFLEIV